MPVALEQAHPFALTTGQTTTSLLLLLLQECSIAPVNCLPLLLMTRSTRWRAYAVTVTLRAAARVDRTMTHRGQHAVHCGKHLLTPNGKRPLTPKCKRPLTHNGKHQANRRGLPHVLLPLQAPHGKSRCVGVSSRLQSMGVRGAMFGWKQHSCDGSERVSCTRGAVHIKLSRLPRFIPYACLGRARGTWSPGPSSCGTSDRDPRRYEFFLASSVLCTSS
jgi:hypothetical protein